MVFINTDCMEFRVSIRLFDSLKTKGKITRIKERNK